MLPPDALCTSFDSLRAELGNTPIKVTLVCPGFVRTNVSVNALTGDGSKQNKMDDATDHGMEPDRLAKRSCGPLKPARKKPILEARKCWECI